MSRSLTSQAKWFQLFQPIGGVPARPWNVRWTPEPEKARASGARSSAMMRDAPPRERGGIVLRRDPMVASRRWTRVGVRVTCALRTRTGRIGMALFGQLSYPDVAKPDGRGVGLTHERQAIGVWGVRRPLLVRRLT